MLPPARLPRRGPIPASPERAAKPNSSRSDDRGAMRMERMGGQDSVGQHGCLHTRWRGDTGALVQEHRRPGLAHTRTHSRTQQARPAARPGDLVTPWTTKSLCNNPDRHHPSITTTTTLHPPPPTSSRTSDTVSLPREWRLHDDTVLLETPADPVHLMTTSQPGIGHPETQTARSRAGAQQLATHGISIRHHAARI